MENIFSLRTQWMEWRGTSGPVSVGQNSVTTLHWLPSFTFVFIIFTLLSFYWLISPLPLLLSSCDRTNVNVARLHRRAGSIQAKHHSTACLWCNKLWWRCFWQKLFNTISLLTAPLKPRPSGQRYDSSTNKPVRITADLKKRKRKKKSFLTKGRLVNHCPSVTYCTSYHELTTEERTVYGTSRNFFFLRFMLLYRRVK